MSDFFFNVTFVGILRTCLFDVSLVGILRTCLFRNDLGGDFKDVPFLA